MSDIEQVSGNEVEKRKLFVSNIPEKHRVSNDSRLQWLWMQRLVIVQSVYERTNDIQDRMAASLVLKAAMSADLSSIELLLRRLEGGARTDQAVMEEDSLPT